MTRTPADNAAAPIMPVESSQPQDAKRDSYKDFRKKTYGWKVYASRLGSRHALEAPMTKTSRSLLAGAAILAVTATAALADSKEPAFHEMTIQLPGGGTEHVRYTGNAPPQIVVAPNGAWAGPFAAAFAAPFFGFGPAAADLERISAQMDAQMRQMNAMVHEAETMAMQNPQGRFEAALRNAPAGSYGYSSVSVWSSNGTCTRTVRMVEPGQGAQPQFVSNTSGNCGSAPAATQSANGVIQTKATPQPQHPSRTRI